MSMGMINKGLNAIFFKKWLVLFFEVFTGLVIFWGLIGWLVFLVLYKWMFYPVNAYAAELTNPAEFAKLNMSPSLINTMTSLTVSLGKTPESPNPLNPGELVEVEFFPNQTSIGIALVLGVGVAVPLMLCVIPLAACCSHKKEAPAGNDFEAQKGGENEENRLLESGNGDEPVDDAKADIKAYQALLDDGEDEGGHGLDEIFIHQMIETIEFVLNCISNTASYLRLWALSLAHSELADVFLVQMLGAVWKMNTDSGVGMITLVTFLVGFAWAAATTGILLLMDFVECLLHTQRLHWVEFMSKFFGGGGY